jgi:cobalamin biosynthesis Mg chelatase CobN
MVVITEQRYIDDLVTILEAQGILPLPIFINGVEAHTIVRDLFTSQHEIDGVARGTIVRDKTYQSTKAAQVDAIVSTIGFPLYVYFINAVSKRCDSSLTLRFIHTVSGVQQGQWRRDATCTLLRRSCGI